MATGHILGGFFLLIILIKSESHSVVSDSLWPHVLYSPWNSPGQNTGMCSLSLLQGIFPTQESNPGLPHCRWILYQRTQKGSPRILERLINLKWGRAGTACSGSVTCWVLAIWAQEDSMSAWSWQANIGSRWFGFCGHRRANTSDRWHVHTLRCLDKSGYNLRSWHINWMLCPLDSRTMDPWNMVFLLWSSIMDCCLPGSSVHGIFQAWILESVAIPFSRGSSRSRDQTRVSYISGRFLTIWATREAS